MQKLSIGLIAIVLIFAGCTKETISPLPEATEPPVASVTNDATQPPTKIPEGQRISQIQGKAHRSPLEGKIVENVYGIVTVKRGDGFYMQDPNPDEDIATSEGIFVTTRGVPRVNAGDAILVKSATIDEFNPAGIGENSLTITQLVSVEYEVLSSGNTLPTATVIGIGGRPAPDAVIDDDINGYAGRNGSFDPESDGIDFYESLESMLVQVNNAAAVSATSSYKEIAIVPDGRAQGGVYSPRGAIILQEFDANPERILLDDAFISMPEVRVGDVFTEPILGVVDYTFGNYKLQLIKKPAVKSMNLKEETVQFTVADDQLVVATYNVENLDALENPKFIERLASHIVYHLKSPDIIGLQEVMDNDGEVDSLIVSADQSFTNIIQTIKKQGGPDYFYLDIDPVRNADGGVPGGNIRVGFLYRTDRGLQLVKGVSGDAETAVEVVNTGVNPSFSVNPGRIEPLSYAFQESRKPLAAMFEFNGQFLYVIVNHLNSKSGDGSLFGDIQPPNLESESQRVLQTKLIHGFAEDILKINPEAMVIVMGDLNDFPWSEPIKTLSGEILTNLVTELPLEEQYTYIYEGNAQVLDQILVSESLAEKLSSVDVVHLNSEFYYQDRVSDHDPVVAIFDLK
jgi:predicted extracellular nuclease